MKTNLGRLFSGNRILNTLTWIEVIWKVWFEQYCRVVWIECYDVTIYRVGIFLRTIRMVGVYRYLCSWPNRKALLAWFIEAATRGTDLPLFPHTVVFQSLMKAIQAGKIAVPKKQREEVAGLILKVRLDMATKEEVER